MSLEEHNLFFSGMHCDACEKTIKMALNDLGIEVLSISHKNQHARVRYDDSTVSFEKISKAVSDVGYELVKNPQQQQAAIPTLWGRVKDVVSEAKNNPTVFENEKRILYSTLGILLIVGLCEYLAYVLFFWNIEDFWKTYGQYIVYLSIAVVATGGAVRQLRAYRGNVSCMTGMMIGMTIGMISSLLLGIVMGATNGMFVGSVFAMAVGMSIGAWAGACCGVMGIMEGMMAGLMGGTMGPMIAVMMFTDRLSAFLPIFFVACLMILFGLVYLVFKEHKARQTQVKPYGFWSYAAINFLVVFLATLIMVWGPKAPFLGN